MKLCFFYSLVLLFLCISNTKAQTNANIAGPENVLVVYKTPEDSTDQIGIISQNVMLYYKNARGIPASNILKLNSLINADIFDSVSNTTHRIEITQDGEIISDGTILSYGPIYRHSWLYFVKKIAKPIADHLQF
ncbi:MAG: hypothetical protein Q8N03_17310 [Ignavibacteria bacterium]|nr:hypothetical protein [Ignavibacteria bacterium]MDP3830595.1 hypothetical protein [Ignavibacteriaceae bacterium]